MSRTPTDQDLSQFQAMLIVEADQLDGRDVADVYGIVLGATLDQFDCDADSWGDILVGALASRDISPAGLRDLAANDEELRAVLVDVLVLLGE